MGVVAELREVIQDLVAPELKEIRADLKALAENQSLKLDTLAQNQRERLDNLVQNQSAMKTELLQAIVQSEERLMLTIKVALLSQQNEQLQKKVNELQGTPH